MEKVRWSVTPAKAAKDNNISDTAFRTLSILGIYTDENGMCWPSMGTIAKIRGMTRQAIQKHITELEKAGYLIRKPRFLKNQQQSNRFQVRFDFDPATSEVAPLQPQKLPPPATSEVAQNDKYLRTTSDNDLRAARPKKTRSPAQQANDVIHDAISEVTKTPSGSFNGKVTAQLKAELPDKTPEYIAAEVRRRYGVLWYQNDWRGRKGDPPKIQDIYPEWNRVLGGVSVADHNQKVIADIIEKGRMERHARR